MEHIVLTEPIIIFDCIEFNDRFRYSDILSDIAFLLMDLEFNNGEKFSKLTVVWTSLLFPVTDWHSHTKQTYFIKSIEKYPLLPRSPPD